MNATRPTVAMTTDYDKFAWNPDAYAIQRVWYYLVGVAGTLVGGLGLLCNGLSIAVLVHRDMRASPATLYLITLVIYDIVFLLTNTAFVSVEYLYFGLTDKNDWHAAYVQPGIPVASAFMNVAISGSAYTTVALTLDRCVGVRWPFHWSNICTPRRIRVVLATVFVWACLLNVPLMLEHEIVWQTPSYSNQSQLVAVVTTYQETFFHSTVYLKFLNPLFDSAVPVVAIAVVNMVIAWTLHRRLDTSRAMSRCEQVKERTGKDCNRITLQVVAISIFTLVSRLLRVSTFLVFEHHQTVIVDACPLYCGTLAAVAIFWNILNSTVNFFLYYFFGQKFRSCFIQRYKCCVKDDGRAGMKQCLRRLHFCCHDVTLHSSATSVYDLGSSPWPPRLTSSSSMVSLQTVVSSSVSHQHQTA